MTIKTDVLQFGLPQRKINITPKSDMKIAPITVKNSSSGFKDGKQSVIEYVAQKKYKEALTRDDYTGKPDISKIKANLVNFLGYLEERGIVKPHQYNAYHN